MNRTVTRLPSEIESLVPASSGTPDSLPTPRINWGMTRAEIEALAKSAGAATGKSAATKRYNQAKEKCREFLHKLM